MEILAFDRQIAEVRENVTADLGKFGRVVRADIEDLRLLFLGKSMGRTAKIIILPALPEASNKRFESALKRPGVSASVWRTS